MWDSQGGEERRQEYWEVRHTANTGSKGIGYIELYVRLDTKERRGIDISWQRDQASDQTSERPLGLKR